MGKTLILFSSRAEDRNFATEIALSAGLTLRVTADPKDFARALDTDKPFAILVDAPSEAAFNGLETAVQEVHGLFSEKIEANRFFFLIDNEPHSSSFLFRSPLFGNLYLRHLRNGAEAYAKSGEFFGRLLKALEDQKSLDLSKVVKESANLQKVVINNSGLKQGAVEAVRNFLLKAKFQGRIASLISNAVDEMIMNAIFDAPVDAVGKPIYAKSSRAQIFDLDAKAQVEMHVGYDGEYFIASVVDQWGSLDKSKLMSHFSKAYDQDDYQVKSVNAGAGLGLFTAFNLGGSFIFQAEAGGRTQVTVIYRKTDDFKTFRSQCQFLMTQFFF